MGFYTLTAVKFALGMLVMILQINILGKHEFSLNTPLNQVQNYVLGGIIGGVIYNTSVSVLQFLIVLLIWSLVVVVAKLLFESSKALRHVAFQPELLVCDGKVDVSRCEKVGLAAEQLSRRLREEGIPRIRDVEAAVMETDGRLTVRARGTQSRGPLLPLVSDGWLVDDGLRLAGKDEAWVMGQLRAQGYVSVRQVFLGELVDGNLEVVPFARARGRRG
jgi:uncharacterized membrane protein YcaP (DUF421 family)